MIGLLQLILHILALLFKSRARLEAEILVLRQQLNVLRRQVSKRPQLNNADRFLLVWLYRWFPSVLGAIAIVRPETIIRWHRHLWGAPHIHGELLKLGFTLAQSTVARYMYRGPPSQGWRTFLTNHADRIAAIDLFVLPTITFRLLYCLVILRHGRRLWVSFGVTANPTAEWISHQITEAFPWDSAPRYLIRDRDTAYGPIFVQRLRAMGIRDKPIAPGSPWQNAYAERLIGTIRRECLGHMIVFGQAHLRRILDKYAANYNESRIHRSLDQDAPFHRAIERLGVITSQPVLGGLHHQYCRI
jgi:transposase InsO family protein